MGVLLADHGAFVYMMSGRACLYLSVCQCMWGRACACEYAVVRSRAVTHGFYPAGAPAHTTTAVAVAASACTLHGRPSCLRQPTRRPPLAMQLADPRSLCSRLTCARYAAG